MVAISSQSAGCDPESGVVGEDLGQGAGFVLLEGVDLLKELDEGLGIVAGLVHVLDPSQSASASSMREN